MDAHEKGAVLTACGLPTKLRGLLQLMLFTLAAIGADEFTATVATIAAAANISDSTAGRYLRQLAALDFIVITNNGAIGRRGYPPQQRPNSYRIMTNAERTAHRAEAAAEVELLVCQIDCLDSPEERKILPSVGTGDSTKPEGKTLTNREEPPMWQTKPVSPEVLAVLRQQLQDKRDAVWWSPQQSVGIATPTAPVRTDNEPIDSQPGRPAPLLNRPTNDSSLGRFGMIGRFSGDGGDGEVRQGDFPPPSPLRTQQERRAPSPALRGCGSDHALPPPRLDRSGNPA